MFNEILPSPVGQDSQEEWIELFNAKNYATDLSGWKITDTKGSIKSYVFPIDSQIPGQGFLVIDRPQTKITLNNDNDGLQITNKEGIVIDAIEYIKAPKGQSYSRMGLGWAWSKNPTPGSKNVISGLENKKMPPRIDSKKTITEPTPIEKIEEKKRAADISEQIPKTYRPLNIFFIAFPLAIFSGIIMFLLKNRLNK